MLCESISAHHMRLPTSLGPAPAVRKRTIQKLGGGSEVGAQHAPTLEGRAVVGRGVGHSELLAPSHTNNEVSQAVSTLILRFGQLRL
eukprot:13348036-Alexandrium_andersonii.AAC.1